uniref:TNFR-Cys domain-containing protein n=2 Tax=Latimeria chalumnae TaxID=7897 RepID=H3BI15_LATCH
MCPPGSIIGRDCTPLSNTTCLPCGKGTYMDHPNGLSECLACKVCDPDLGLSVHWECTDTQNTKCVCKKGYFCIDSHSSGCGACKKQLVCKPGEKVKTEGTETKNTVCEPCPNGTFSETEMSQTCLPWTNCAERGIDKAGSSTSDVICTKESFNVVTVAVISVLVAVIIGVMSYLAWKKLQKFCQKKQDGYTSPKAEPHNEKSTDDGNAEL